MSAGCFHIPIGTQTNTCFVSLEGVGVRGMLAFNQSLLLLHSASVLYGTGNAIASNFWCMVGGVAAQTRMEKTCHEIVVMFYP